MIKQAISVLVNGDSLNPGESAQAMSEIMEGDATPAQISAFVTALRIKGETLDEILSMARVMREKSLRVEVDDRVIDTCGTGGDSSGTFNISTTVGLVVAGAGVKVAKHGNRAASGATGSADVLEELGVKIDLGPEGVKICIDEIGFGFMFAQIFHPAMRFAAVPRREIGIRTIFNTLGPLMNPANASAQVFGMADPSLADTVAQFLDRRGTTHALIVHGHDGLDEISLSGPTDVWELENGDVTFYTIGPEEFGLESINSSLLKVDSIAASATMLRDVLQGNHGPARDMVLANSAAALVAAGDASTLKEGVSIAAKSIDRGEAKNKLDALIELSNRVE